MNSGLSVLRSGTLQFTDFLAGLQLFDSYLVAGVQLIKVWATFDPDLNWTGVADPILELILSRTDGSDGLDLVRYNLGSSSQPNGFYTAPFTGEFGADENVHFEQNLPKAGGVMTTPGSLQVQGSGAITPTAGTWEVYALIYTPA